MKSGSTERSGRPEIKRVSRLLRTSAAAALGGFAGLFILWAFGVKMSGSALLFTGLSAALFGLFAALNLDRLFDRLWNAILTFF